jgi:Zn-finger nucleic acid-binding protein
MFLIAIYEMDRAYGGPEEGGWWYDIGELRRVVASARNEDAAYAKARRANRLLARLREQAGGRSINSVIYDGGHHEARVCENVVPEFFPTHRPHYE